MNSSRFSFFVFNRIPLSQNKTQREPLPFSPLPETQRDDFDDEDFQQENSKRNKVRKIIDEDEPISSADQQNQEEQENDDDDDDDDEQEDDDEPQDNEELLDYKKQWFEMEAEESGNSFHQFKSSSSGKLKRFTAGRVLKTSLLD